MAILENLTYIQLITIMAAVSFGLPVIIVALFKTGMNLKAGKLFQLNNNNMYKAITTIYYNMKEIIQLEKKKEYIKNRIFEKQMNKVDQILVNGKTKWISIFEEMYDNAMKRSNTDMSKHYYLWNYGTEVIDNCFTGVKNNFKQILKNGFYNYSDGKYEQFVNTCTDNILNYAVCEFYKRFIPPEWLNMPSQGDRVKNIDRNNIYIYVKEILDKSKEIKTEEENKLKHIDNKIKKIDEDVKKEFSNE